MLTFDSLFHLFLSPATQLILALLLDKWLGEVSRWHPLVGFGNYTNWLKKKLYPVQGSSDSQKLLTGSFAALAAVIPVWLLVIFVVQIPFAGWLVEGLILYLVIGQHSLAEHAGFVSTALQNNDLTEAREKTGWLVSRQTKDLKPPEMIRATTESVLENGNDAVFGAVFWFIVGGAPAAAIYRLINTLDAMWGYKNDEYFYFGRFAARADDLLNLIPAQCCALTYALFGNTRQAIRCWLTQGYKYKSFNGGAVMASGAGSLNIVLGGSAVYHGQHSSGIQLGAGNPPEPVDIDRAIALVNKGVWLWAVLLLATNLLFI